MDMKSLENAGFENISEPETKTESKNTLNVQEKITSLVAGLREKYPQFIRVFETPKTVARILVMFAMLQGGELFAKDAFTEDIKKNPFSSSEMMDKVPNMSLSEITDSLNQLKLTLPPGKKIAFSHVLKNIDLHAKRGDDQGTESYEGSVPTDTGTVGNVGISVSTSIVERDNFQDHSKHETDTNESNLSSEVKVSEDFTPREIKEAESEAIKISGRGSNKQDAIMDALEKLSDYSGVYVCTGSIMKDESERVGKTENIKRHLTTFTAMNGVSFFVNLHIDKIEETEEGGEIVYIAHVSAKKGELQALEK